VLAELETVIPARRAQLEAVPEGGEVPSPLGRPSTVDRVLRTRIFDTWIHEHDIRSAISHDGGWGTRPAIITFQQISAGVPVMWAKRAAAPIGSTVAVHVTGPFISGTIHATVNAESRGELVPDASEPTVDVTLSWPDLMRLSTGRIDPDDPAVRRRLTLTGDPQLVDAFLHGMVLTP
jgi:SCP-2 sterol transfer family/Mycothiol maleylpyruvate isomerase N-terminal domain